MKRYYSLKNAPIVLAIIVMTFSTACTAPVQKSLPLEGNPSRPVTYNASIGIADQFESFAVDRKSTRLNSSH